MLCSWSFYPYLFTVLPTFFVSLMIFSLLSGGEWCGLRSNESEVCNNPEESGQTSGLLQVFSENPMFSATIPKNRAKRRDYCTSALTETLSAWQPSRGKPCMGSQAVAVMHVRGHVRRSHAQEINVRRIQYGGTKHGETQHGETQHGETKHGVAMP